MALRAIVTIGVLLQCLPGAGASVRVTIDNFLFAESNNYMAKTVKAGGLGKFVHGREVTKVDPSPASAPKHGQDVIRMNRDTLYSMMVLDLQNEAAVTFPNAGRFLSLEFCSEQHDIFPSMYSPGQYVMTRNGCDCEPPCRTVKSGSVCTAFGTDYAFIMLRTLANADNSSDIAEAHKAQDAFVVTQADVGKWEVPDWNHTELVAIRKLLLELKETSTEPTVFGFFSGPEKKPKVTGAVEVAFNSSNNSRVCESSVWFQSGTSQTPEDFYVRYFSHPSRRA